MGPKKAREGDGGNGDPSKKMDQEVAGAAAYSAWEVMVLKARVQALEGHLGQGLREGCLLWQREQKALEDLKSAKVTISGMVEELKSAKMTIARNEEKLRSAELTISTLEDKNRNLLGQIGTERHAKEMAKVQAKYEKNKGKLYKLRYEASKSKSSSSSSSDSD